MTTRSNYKNNLLACITLLALAMMTLTAHAADINLSSDPCQFVTQYSPDGSINYLAGKDIKGRDVVSADLGQSFENVVPETITFPLQIDLLRQLEDVPHSEFLDNSLEADITSITINTKTGKTFINDIEISDQFVSYCNNKENSESLSGQGDTDAIKSTIQTDLD